MSKYIDKITAENKSCSNRHVNSIIKTGSEEEIDAHINKIEKEESLKVLSIFEQFYFLVNMKCNDFFDSNTISDTDRMQFMLETSRLTNKVHDDYRIAAIRFQIDSDITDELIEAQKQARKKSGLSVAELKLAIELSFQTATNNIKEATRSASEIITDAVNDATNELMAILDKYKKIQDKTRLIPVSSNQAF